MITRRQRRTVPGSAVPSPGRRSIPTNVASPPGGRVPVRSRPERPARPERPVTTPPRPRTEPPGGSRIPRRGNNSPPPLSGPEKRGYKDYLTGRQGRPSFGPNSWRRNQKSYNGVP